MTYSSVKEAIFLTRPNRFEAIAEIDGRTCRVHVKNTGRCKELLVPGARVYLEDFSSRMGQRKLAYDLVAVQKGQLLINMDSQAPNKAVLQALKAGAIRIEGMSALSLIRPECVYKDSRFDFYLEDSDGKKAYLEVKGVTLENDETASFPDAPTARGLKHLHELLEAREEGYAAAMLFVIQMKGPKAFRPNRANDPAFADALERAQDSGVELMCYDCIVRPDSMVLDQKVPIGLR